MANITHVFTRIAKKGAFKLKKYAPEILVAVGVTGVVSATVLACKETLDAKPILEDAKNDLDEIHVADNDPRISYEEYSKDQVKRDITRVYVATGKKLAKVYWPSAALMTVSLACMVGSHIMVKRRLNYTLAAYTALSNSFREYRRRLEENLGESTVHEAGDKVSDDHMIKVEDKPSYTLIFDRTNKNWKDSVEYNLTFLKGTQRYLDYELKKWGFMCANDALKELGFEPFENGQIDIWKYNPDNQSNFGDGYISFGLYNKDGSKSEDLIRYEKGEVDYLVLRLNVDQTVYDGI